jgi:hypothetical protein
VVLLHGSFIVKVSGGGVKRSECACGIHVLDLGLSTVTEDVALGLAVKEATHEQME